jgi:hypothetical protein
MKLLILKKVYPENQMRYYCYIVIRFAAKMFGRPLGDK